MDIPDKSHALTVAELGDRLGTGPSGLTEDEAQVRLALYGKNILTEERHGRLSLFIRQFTNIFIAIQIVAAIISFFIGSTRIS